MAKTIGIDFDQTFSADIDLFRLFVTQAKKNRHTCLIVTGRNPDNIDDVVEAVKGLDIPIICCGLFRWKSEEAALNGYNVDIWIDNNPEFITKMAEHNSIKMR